MYNLFFLHTFENINKRSLHVEREKITQLATRSLSYLITYIYSVNGRELTILPLFFSLYINYRWTSYSQNEKDVVYRLFYFTYLLRSSFRWKKLIYASVITKIYKTWKGTQQIFLCTYLLHLYSLLQHSPIVLRLRLSLDYFYGKYNYTSPI
jgi:hypothetical protein